MKHVLEEQHARIAEETEPTAPANEDSLLNAERERAKDKITEMLSMVRIDNMAYWALAHMPTSTDIHGEIHRP